MRPDLAPLAGNLQFVDEVFARYVKDPTSVDPSWRRLFDSQRGEAPAIGRTEGLGPTRAIGVGALIQAFRAHGHLEADLDPLGMPGPGPHPELDQAFHGLTESDLAAAAPAELIHGVASTTVGGLAAMLRRIYCGPVAVELAHLEDPAQRAWLAERMERTAGHFEASRDRCATLLARLAETEAFERFLAHKYVGVKRFSLTGAETLVTLLDQLLDDAGAAGVTEVVLGMTHRGRLNVLVQILAKPARELFAEFEDVDPESTLGAGDVKYHLGYSNDISTRDGHRLHVSLAFNPSHLEAIDPVVVGRVRAKQDRLRDAQRRRVLGVLVHGDAAFAGQGIVVETLNLARLDGYRTGGTVHVVVNNQIGFTTTPHEGRSTTWPTDVAKGLSCPILHVNGDDPEAVIFVAETAMAYRARFASDVVIDLLCYRRYGHNETDEPSFTQPLMVRRIQQQPTAFKRFGGRLAARGWVQPLDADDLVGRTTDALARELELARTTRLRPTVPALGGVWAGQHGGPDAATLEVDTTVPRALLVELADKVTRVPPGFRLHSKIARLFEQRRAMGRGERSVDWGMGELLAYASLVAEGRPVRLSGQDTGRGTFSHRHAVVADQDTGAEHVPLAHLPGSRFEVIDSPLSEAGALGFELGFSLDSPETLVIWEAQFGDFVNGAQVIIDQFLASSEEKWRRLSGLTLFLPHGFEGQGPEHSSARLERFLELSAKDNLQVAQPTTPAQLFHLLRRQVLRPWRKPLVVLTPKSLLRLPAASSPLEEFARGGFARALPDESGAPVAAIDRLIFCSGKIYFDLVEERTARGAASTAIARLEQLTPWRDDDVARILASYPRLAEVRWVQEEPANMGAGRFVAPRLQALLGRTPLRLASRPDSASPATGSHSAHVIEQRTLLAEAFGAA